MKKYFCLLVLFLSAKAYTQVPKQHVAEHITNTSCSVCAANNASIHQAMRTGTHLNTLSIHPSKPYASDVFNQQNKSENDARTIYYNAFGSTPKLVFNGVLLSNYATLAQEIKKADGTEMAYAFFQIDKINGENKVRIKLHILNRDSLPANAFLFVCLREDTVFETTNNGETQHLQVMRKILSTVKGDSIPIQTSADSIELTYSYTPESFWNMNRMSVLVMLTAANKTLIQSGVSGYLQTPASGLNFQTGSSLQVYPNPVRDYLYFQQHEMLTVQVTDAAGRVVLEQEIRDEASLDLRSLQAGIYFLSAKSADKLFYTRILKTN